MASTFRETTLDNGLRIAAEVDPDAHTAALGFFVKTGARDETPALMGVSHFLEHMMFKGTTQRTAAQVDLDFDSIGANHNAFTTNEMTAFWAHCLPERLPEAEEVLSDILRPALRPQDFDDERSVILEEIAMYEDQPFWVLFERAMEAYFETHPLSHRVLGRPETIKAMRADQMTEYFRSRYSADNTILAMAGRLDFDAMVERVATHCGGWERTGVVRGYPSFPAPRPDLTITSDQVNRHYLLMLAPGPALRDERRYAASLLMQVLGDTDGSRLYWALVDPGLAEEAQAQLDGRDDCGNYFVFASCSPEHAETVERITLETMDGLVDSITDDDLERVRSRVATAATLHGELPAGRMRRLGRVLTYLEEYRSLEDELARIDAVTLEDLRAVAASFPPRPALTARLTPKT
ncbi:MAG: insulinase family protein [Phycisphaerales bacterium]|nr:insulinase family protein [Phycisphaerae bacterium]NNM25884.1 insulinase family protein [Phycisphaerales bacterium]